MPAPSKVQPSVEIIISKLDFMGRKVQFRSVKSSKSQGLSRRHFLLVAGTSAATVAGMRHLQAANPPAMNTPETLSKAVTSFPLFVATWPFGKPSNDVALNTFKGGGSLLDAIEKGIQLAESDLSNESVGKGGIPNAAGVVQLDACVMWGPTHSAGSVAALEGIEHPISVARRVMEKTPHVMLVGAGAREFALQQGFPSAELLTDSQRKRWEKWKEAQDAKKKKNGPGNHDTIALIGLGPDGTVAGGCSTSGWGYKLPGRVGDSPILGGGLYVDNAVGAAGATGLGENVMRYCGSYQVVEFMRQGMHPQEACIETIKRIASIDPKGYDLAINFIALDKQGRVGAAGTGSGFQYAVCYPGSSDVRQSPGLTAKSVGPIGGNRRQ